ncbi:component of the polarisome, partial [Cryomyces antarcticus]
KVSKAQDLSDALQSELEKLRTSSSNTERGLRAQLEETLAAHDELQSQHRLLRRLPNETASNDWKIKYEDLEQTLLEQQQLTEDVQREAASSLQEMRMLCEESSYALENEERLAERVHQLESEIEEWKARHARTRTQLRKLRASSVGPNSLPDAGLAVRDGGFVRPEGLVQDIHVTEFQLAIDELLQTARRSADSSTTIDRMKSVVMSVRSITQDIDQALDQPADSKQQLAKLRSRVSATANNLITASNFHASADGLSPVSLLDAAASHLATAVIELVRTVKIRPTSASQLEESEGEDEQLVHGRPMPKSTSYFDHTDDTTPQRSRASSRTYSSTSSP